MSAQRLIKLAKKWGDDSKRCKGDEKNRLMGCVFDLMVIIRKENEDEKSAKEVWLESGKVAGFIPRSDEENQITRTKFNKMSGRELEELITQQF